MHKIKVINLQLALQMLVIKVNLEVDFLTTRICQEILRLLKLKEQL
jgi:hypothetical protein